MYLPKFNNIHYVITYYNQGKYEEALEYYNKALTIPKKIFMNSSENIYFINSKLLQQQVHYKLGTAVVASKNGSNSHCKKLSFLSLSGFLDAHLPQ